MKFLFWGLMVCSLVLGATVKDIKSVYLYPMAGGYDQFLANELVGANLFKVVPDPKLADAVFTDQLGSSFLYQVDHIHTPIAPVKTSGSTSSMPVADPVPHPDTFNRAKGTLFLVDLKSKQIVWSTFKRPKNTTSTQLHKTAQKVIKGLGISMAPPVVSH